MNFDYDFDKKKQQYLIFIRTYFPHYLFAIFPVSPKMIYVLGLCFDRSFLISAIFVHFAKQNEKTWIKIDERY